MKKRNTVYEDRAEKEEARRERHRSDVERHTVLCPHCQKPVLDHMTKCPKCGGELTPDGYRPPNPKTMKIIKIVSYTIGFAVAAVIAVMIIFFKK